MNKLSSHCAVLSRFIFIMIVLLAGITHADSGIAFPDPNLMQVVLDAVGKDSPPILNSDLVGLTTLDATDMSICNLVGLEACTDLTTLKLGWNRISDIWPLKNLSQLRKLELHRNYVFDIDALENLTNIVELDLHRNFITDINALSHLSNLEILNLEENCVKNLEPLQDLISLQEIRLFRNWINDVSALAANPGINRGDVVDVNNNLLTRSTYEHDVTELEQRLGYRICEPYDPNKGDPHVLDFPVFWAKGEPYSAEMPINNNGIQGGWSCGQVAHSMILYYWSLQNAIHPTGSYWYYREDTAEPIGADFSEPFLWEDMLPSVTGLHMNDPRVIPVADLAYRFTIATRTDWWMIDPEDRRGLKYKEGMIKYFGIDPSEYVEDVKIYEQESLEFYQRTNSEIDAGRPCQLHIASNEGGVHEVVITGYRKVADHYEYSIHFGYQGYMPHGSSRYDPSQFYSLHEQIGGYDKVDSFQITWGIKPYKNQASIPTYNKISETSGALIAGYNTAAIVWNGKEYAAALPTGTNEQRGLSFQRISTSGLPLSKMVPLADSLPNDPGVSLCWNGAGYAAVWDESSQGSPGIIISLLTETGERISDLRLSNIGSMPRPHITWNDRDREYGLVFRDGEGNVNFVRLSGNGTLLDTPAQELGRKRHPDILWTGEFYAISWAYQQRVYLELRGSNGDPQGGRFGLYLPLSKECTESTVAFDSEGYGVAWIERRDGDRYVVSFCKANTDGEFLTDTQITVSDMDNFARNVDLSFANGEYYLTYRHRTSQTPYVTYISRISKAGELLETRWLFRQSEVAYHTIGAGNICVLQMRNFSNSLGQTIETETCLIPEE